MADLPWCSELGGLAEQHQLWWGISGDSIHPGHALPSPVCRTVPVLVLGLLPGVCLQPEVMIPGARPRSSSRLQREVLRAPGWFVYLIGTSSSLCRAFLCSPKALDAAQRALMQCLSARAGNSEFLCCFPLLPQVMK